MRDEATATLLAAGSAGAAGLSKLLPEGAGVELFIGLAGSLLGGAIALKVAVAVLETKTRQLTESDRDLWTEIGKIRDAHVDHLERFHTSGRR